MGGQPGVVHEPGHRPEPGGGKERVDGVRVGNITGNSEGAGIGGSDSGHHPLGRRLILEVAEHDTVPQARQVQGGGCSDTAATAGNDGDRAGRGRHAVILQQVADGRSWVGRGALLAQVHE